MVDIAGRAVAAARRARRGQPGTHALIIGVSRYRHLEGGPAESERGLSWEMGQLSAAAASASQVAGWLATRYHNPDAPLATLRVLLSPQPDETLDPQIARHVRAARHRATRKNVEAALAAFRDDVARDPRNTAFVYIAGHGVQLTRDDTIVLLEDVGDPAHLTMLHGAIDAAGCHAGMAAPVIPATQFWFIDACRQRPQIAERFERLPGALTLDRPLTEPVSPCYLAAGRQELAFARPGERTLFCEALLDALDGGVSDGPTATCPSWYVSSYSLYRYLKETVGKLASEDGEVQTVFLKGDPSDGVVHRLPAPPRVALRVELRPQAAAGVTSASLLLDARIPVRRVPRRWPLVMRLPAGLYLLNLKTRAPFKEASRILDLVPPSLALEAEVLP